MVKSKVKKLFNSESCYYSGSKYSVDHNVKDESTLDMYKKDKKHNSDCSKTHVDSLLNNRGILSSEVLDLDSNFINKHLDSENNLTSSSINFRDNETDGTVDIYRQDHLVRGVSAGTLRKKSKRDNDQQSFLSKDCNAQIVNHGDSSYSTEVVFDGSLIKKRKNEDDQSRNDIRFVNIDQVSNNQTLQCSISKDTDDHIQKKHKKAKQDISEGGLENIVNNAVNNISYNFEKNLDDPLTTVSSKKKHRVTSDNIQSNKDVHIAEVQNYFMSNQNDTEWDMLHKKKHKKQKYKDNNLTEGLENGSQKSECCNIFCLNDSVSGDSVKIKHKKNKHIVATTATDLTNYTGNKITDISEEQYLDASVRKKHKNHKHISNEIEDVQNVNIAEKNCQGFELPSNETSDILSKKMYKKQKKEKEDKLAQVSCDISEEQYLDVTLKKKHKKHKHLSNDIEAIQYVNISEKNSQGFELPSNETSDTLIKKKNKKHKKNYQISCDISSEQHLDVTLKKKHKHISSDIEAVQDVNISKKDCQFYELPSNETYDMLGKKKHKKHKKKNDDKLAQASCDISEDQYLDVALKKKHRKHMSNDIESTPDVNIAEKNCQESELPSHETYDMLGKKRHKKHKKKNDDKLTQASCDISEEQYLDVNLKKKHLSNDIEAIPNVNIAEKNCQESELPSHETYDMLGKKRHKKHKKNYDKLAQAPCGISEDQYLNVAMKKKHKKHKDISNDIEAIPDVNIAEKNCQESELPSQEISDILSEKKHKKHKKNKSNKPTQDSENTDSQIFENCEIHYLNEPVLSSHIKKKNIENSLASSNKFIDKNNFTKDQHLEVSISHNSLEKEHNYLTEHSVNKITGAFGEHCLDASLKKKHKKDKHKSNGTEAVQDTNVAESCQHFEVPTNEMSSTFCKKKHKKNKKNKEDKLTQNLEKKDNQTFKNHDNPYMNESVFSSHIKIKGKEKNLTTLNNSMDKTGCEVTSNTDYQHLEFLNSNNSLKKKHKRHNNTEINSYDSTTAVKDNLTQISNYENSFMEESVIDTLPKQRHKKYNDIEIVNIIGSFSDVDKNSSSNNMHGNLPDSKTSKVKKKSKEKKIIATGIDLVEDVYEVPYLDVSSSDRTCKKKHKKCKRNDSSMDEDLDQLISNCEKQVYDYVPKRKHKNIEDTSEDSTSVNQSGHKYSNNCGQAYSNTLSSTKQNKSADVIHNGCDLNDTRNDSIVRDQISLYASNKEMSETNSLKKKKRSKKKEIITAVTDNNDKILLCASNDEKSELDSSIHTKDSANIEKSKEPCKNAFEIVENISKEEENIKENKFIDLDLTEDYVDFEIPLLHARESLRNLSEEEKNELISQGVHIKTGKFTQEEDAIILKNIEDFQKTYNILDISEVLGIGRLKKDFCSTKFLKAKHFYARLGKGLNDRTLISIYKRARRLIHPYKTKEKFHETEIRSLKFLRKVVNSKWIHIGDALGRTEDKCLQAYRWHGKQISQGKWTKEEEQQLIAAIEKVSGISDLSCDKLKGISWDEVATHVPTRNFSQCRMHWAFHLAWKPGALKQKWDKNCQKKLIAILKNEWYVENASEIDWLKVYESFVDVAPSDIFLHKRWLYLRSQIEGFKTLCYRDTVDILCKKYNITPNERHTTFS